MTSTNKLINKAYKQTYETLFAQALHTQKNGFYDEAALPSYTHGNRLMAWLFWQRIHWAFKLLPPIEHGDSVLDFGCGGGVSFCALHTLGADITGCDIDHASLAADNATKLGIDATTVSTLEELNNQKFDYIFALDVLEHVDNLDAYIVALKSLSKPGAIWILSGPTENLLYKTGRLLAGFSGHYHCRNVYQIEDDFLHHRLTREKAKTLYWPIPLFRVSRWKCP